MRETEIGRLTEARAPGANRMPISVSFSSTIRKQSHLDVQYLPTTEEQAWLIRAVAELVRKCGHDQFVSMPIVEPTRHFFPDRWTFSPRGLDRVVRRLMQYAQLSDLDLQLLTFSETEKQKSDGKPYDCRSVAGASLKIDAGKCYLSFNENAPADAEYMAGV